MAELDPTGGDVVVDADVTIRTPGLTGNAEGLAPTYDGLRSGADDDPALTDALEDAGMAPQSVVVVSDAMETPGDFGGSRTAYGEAAIEVDVRSPDPGQEQVVLFTDEAGVMTWHFAGAASGEGTVRGDGRRTYRVARRTPPPSDATGTRSLALGLGQKLIRILTFKAAGVAADAIVDTWERSKRPHRLRTFDEADFSARGTDLGGDALRPYAGQRSLLLIHGTSSTTEGGFANIHADLLRELQRQYGGRIFAFDHPSIATAPDANVRWLIDNLPGDGWELDVIAHSRGGLVARTLVERTAEASAAGDRIKLRRVVFLGTPNAGTPLADMDHMQGFVDIMTNLLQLFAVGIPVAATLAGVLEVVKQLAAGAIAGLDGLQSMHPRGSYLRDLGGGSTDVQYFGLASNFEPGRDGHMGFKDFVIDTIFTPGVDNDLVVPTLGVYDLGAPKGSFPLADYHAYPASDSVDHSAYISQATAVPLITAWLARS